MPTRISTTLVKSLLLLALGNVAALSAKAQDLAGATDHPLVSRYSGAVLNSVVRESFAELELPRADKPPAGRWGEAVGGRLSAHQYLLPIKRTPLEAFRNYEQALKQGGFELLFKCELAACDARRINGQGGLAGQVIGRRFLDAPFAKSGASAEWTDNPSYFLSAQLKRASGNAYLLLWVTPGYGGGEAGVFQFIVEAQPMETGKVLVDAGALDKGVLAEGRVALYGLYFDTGKADLKPESKPQLAEIGKWLKSNPALKLYVVGHTDNQGAWDANLSLAQRRAEAVVAALVGTQAVDAKRLAPRAAASMAPVASNRADAGRAKNRRVELVEQ